MNFLPLHRKFSRVYVCGDESKPKITVSQFHVNLIYYYQ